MELRDLVGKHKLSGFSSEIRRTENDYYNEDFSVVQFRLNGVIYEAHEDPSDGYRSYLGQIVKTDLTEMKNTFPPQKVYAKMKVNDPKNPYDTDEILEFFDQKTDKLILEIGTSNIDDYYPSCIMNWSPQNMNINDNR